MASGRLARTCSAPCTSISRRTSAPSGGSGNGRPHQVVEELGPLEELALGHRVLEGGPVDEDVGAPLLLPGRGALRGPAAAEPEGGVRGDELGGKRALAGPPGPMSTKISGSARSLFEQRLTLLGTEPLEPAAVADADGLHQAACLDLPQTGQGLENGDHLHFPDGLVGVGLAWRS